MRFHSRIIFAFSNCMLLLGAMLLSGCCLLATSQDCGGYKLSCQIGCDTDCNQACDTNCEQGCDSGCSTDCDSGCESCCEPQCDTSFSTGVLSDCESCAGCRDCAQSRLAGLTKLVSHNSCKGGCGEIYFDEWLNEKPCPDKCCFATAPSCDTADSCDGCDSGSQCNPEKKKRGLLVSYGKHFKANCSSSLICNGCDNCEGPQSVISSSYEATPSMSPSVIAASIPEPKQAPEKPISTRQTEFVPTPAPITRTSAKINPAKQRQSVRQAFYNN